MCGILKLIPFKENNTINRHATQALFTRYLLTFYIKNDNYSFNKKKPKKDYSIHKKHTHTVWKGFRV